MKNFLFFVFILSNSFLFSQNVGQIGVGTEAPLTNGAIYSPVCKFSGTGNPFSRCNILYTAGELSAVGITSGATVQKLGFYKIGSGSNSVGSSLKIYMRNSTVSPPLVVGTLWADILSTHQLHYTNTAQIFSATPGWVEFQLDVPFIYTGDNIEIAFDSDFSGSSSAGSFDWQYTSGYSDYIIGYVSSSAGTGLTGTVANYKQRANIQMHFLPGVACSGTPVAGNSVVNNSVVCQNTNINLSLSGNVAEANQTYVWQFSNTIAGTYSDVTASSNSSLSTVAVTQSGFYQCKVTCGANSSTSTPVEVTVNPAFPSGTYTIDNTLSTGGNNFASFTDAFNALNCGVLGNATFNVAAGQTFNENPPVLEASGSTSASIIFQKSGVGANPVIMPVSPGTVASSTTIAGNGDGVIVINGGDYITFDGIDINTTGFTSGADQFEYGYFLKKKSSSDGSKNITIKHATITLTKGVRSAGILVSSVSGTAVVNASSVGGRSENIKISGNTMIGCYEGIVVRGSTTEANYDFNIEIGVDSGNVITEFGGGASAAYGIYSAYANNLKIGKNIITSASSGQTTSTLYGIYTTTSNNANVDIYKNTITLTGSGTSGSLYGISNNAGGTGVDNIVRIYDNIVSGCTSASSTTSGAFYAIDQGASAYDLEIYGNYIHDNSHDPSTTGAMHFIYNDADVVHSAKIYNNRIENNIRMRGTTGASYGIYNDIGANASTEIYGNVIQNTNITGSTATVAGIYHLIGSNNKIYNNNISNIVLQAGTTGTVSGIILGSGGVTNKVYNNFISDLHAPASTASSEVVRGINITSTTTNSVQYLWNNTVFLNANAGGTNFGSAALYHTGATSVAATTSALHSFNNIFINTSIANGSGYSSAYRRSTTGNANFINSDNNLYYASGSSNQVIFYNGTTSYTDIAAYRTAFTGKDLASVVGLPPFVSTNTPFDLHLQATSPTQVESGGTPLAEVTKDIDGDMRNATTPDIGADEFNGISADLSGPIITYTALPVKSICIDVKTITATIEDPSGVNTANGTKPRLWFKKANEADVVPGANNSSGNGWKYVEASNAVSPFSFTMDYSLLTSPVVAGDSISYFIVAQDLAASPNVGIMSGVFAGVQSNVSLSSNAFPLSGNVNGYSILVQPNPIIITANRNEICNSGEVKLNIDGIDITGGDVQWQSSPAGENNWSDIIGGNVIPFTTPTISDTTDFRLVVKCGGVPISTSPSAIVTVNVNNPAIVSTSGATRCGTGSVTLQATSPAGTTIKWYENATGGEPIATGNTLVTPVVNSTTNFYAAAVSGGGLASVGKNAYSPNPTSGSGTTNTGIVFDALSDFVLSTVDIYPSTGTGAATTGTVTIDLLDASNNVVLSKVVNVSANPTASPVVQTVTLDFNIPQGTNYKLRHMARSTGISGLLFDPSANSPGGNWGYPYEIPGIVSLKYSNLTAGAATPRTDLYYYFYNWQILSDCEGPRTPVTATVTAPPALSLVNPNKAICPGTIDSLEVVGAINDYTNLSWSPVLNLYTDPSATIPYTGGNATKVYVKGDTEGLIAYALNASNTGTSCANVLHDTVNVIPTTNITASKEEFCFSGSSLLSLTGDFDYSDIQWQSSANGTTYNDINGANGPTYTTGAITETTHYRALVKSSNGAVCQQPTINIIVNNPQILSTTPATNCGPGDVTLQATASPGSTINWYAASTGGTALATGSPFQTGNISTTTTYYVAASGGGGGLESAGRATNTATSNTIGNDWGLIFNVNNDPISLISVDVLSVTTSGMLSVNLTDNNGAVLQTAGPFSFPGGTTASPAVVTLPLNFSIGVGTGYRLIAVATSGGNLIRETSGITYPIVSPSGNVSITNGYINGTSTTYYWFYNWQVSSGCESSRQAVTATIDNTPGCNPVPVTLVNFTGEKRGAINRLSWTTATEVNNAGFELQRSTDGVNFSKLSFVSSKAENGNSTSKLDYFYNDEQPLKGINYYRLKQLDKDGKYDYSGVVKLDGDRVTEVQIVSVYPNPVRDRLNIKLQSPVSKKGTVIVTDAMGKVLMQQAVELVSGDSRLDVNVSRLAQGNYFVKVICADGCTTAIHRFIKE